MTARATARASASSAAPVTTAVMSVVAPSPSAACWRARSRATASMAAPSTAASGVPASAGAAAWRPGRQHEHRVVGRRVAIDRELVPGPGRDRSEQAPQHSGAWPRHRSARPRASSPCSGGSSRRPSRSRTRSPSPARRRHRAARRSSSRPSSPSRSSAAPRPSPSGRRSWPPAPARARLSPAPTLSNGSRVPMTPVERWSVSCVAAPVASARSRAISRWSSSPASPVAALAEPLVEMTASAHPNPPRGSPDEAARWRRRQSHGRGRERVRGEDGGRGGRTKRRDGDGEVRPTGGLDPGRESAGLEAGRHHGASLDRREDGRRHRDRGVAGGGGRGLDHDGGSALHGAMSPVMARAAAGRARPFPAARG